MKAHLTYLGFQEKWKTETIPWQDKHTYRIARIEGGYAIPVGWSNSTEFARVGQVITEDQLQYAIAKNILIETT